MKVTNAFSLPASFVKFCEDQNKPLKNTIRVTELINPPKIRILKRKNWKNLEIDASEQIWALLGTSVHFILEEYTDSKDISEEKLKLVFPQVEGTEITLSGRPDLLSKDGVLSDYKVTSVWSSVFGYKPEWEQQLNVYAYMYARFPKLYPKISKLQIVAIYRDWNKNEQYRNDKYPKIPCEIVSIPKWDHKVIEKFIFDRIRIHIEAENELPDCTDVERWEKKTTFAVKNQGLKRALRVFDTNEEALQFIKENINKGTLSLEERKGMSMRCKYYCNALPFCEQGRKLVEKEETNGS